MYEHHTFKNGEWHTVSLPNYSDPSWGFTKRQKLASDMFTFQKKGYSEEKAFLKAEELAFQESRGNNIAPQSTKKNSAV
jgi:hypothetical protein